MSQIEAVFTVPVVTEDSVFTSYTGSPLEKVELIAGSNTILSTVLCNGEKSGDLLFFGEKPFHALLAKKWEPYLRVYSRSRDPPSITYKPAKETLSWDSVKGKYYQEDVVVSSETGKKNLIMIYHPIKGGFVVKKQHD